VIKFSFNLLRQHIELLQRTPSSLLATAIYLPSILLIAFFAKGLTHYSHLITKQEFKELSNIN